MSDERTLRMPENIELKHLRARVEEAERLIARAVELMTTDQLRQWDGVRAWQEEE